MEKVKVKFVEVEWTNGMIWYASADHFPSNFLKAVSSANFTWFILQYFVPNIRDLFLTPQFLV